MSQKNVLLDYTDSNSQAGLFETFCCGNMHILVGSMALGLSAQALTKTKLPRCFIREVEQCSLYMTALKILGVGNLHNLVRSKAPQPAG